MAGAQRESGRKKYHRDKWKRLPNYVLRFVKAPLIILSCVIKGV